MVLFLVGAPDDAAVQWMTAECERRDINALLFCPRRFPGEGVLTVRPSATLLDGTIELHDQSVPLAAISAVWCYLAGDPQPDREIDDLARHLVGSESRETLNGLYRTLEDRIWVNLPRCERHARSRIFQLRLAAQAGLRIPRTLVSNDPARMLDFVDACGGWVAYKPLGHLLAPDKDGAPDELMFVTRLSRADVEAHADALRLAPCIFQEVVPKQRDITLYVIGEQVWAAAVTPPAEAEDQIDYRRLGVWSHVYTPVLLPPAVEHACVRFTRQLGLSMCNLDLIQRPDDEYVFVDANPTDQWAEIEWRTGFPLCAALVDELSATATLTQHPYLRDRSLAFRPSNYSATVAVEAQPC